MRPYCLRSCLRSVIVACGLAVAGAYGAFAQEAAVAKPAVANPAVADVTVADMAPIEYVAPTDPADRDIYEFAKRVRLLERARAFFTPFTLPRPLALKTKGCAGDINAYYENDVIAICYEYLRYIADLARSRTRPPGLSESDAFLGPAVEVVLHEGGHALFEYLNVPLFGKEEDAADQLASLGLLSFDEPTSRVMMAGVLHMYMVEGGYRNIRKLNRKRLAIVDAKASSDEHSTPLQRMYSALCMAVGSGRPGYAEIARQAGLSEDRAQLCPGEYRQAVHAFRTLLLPHVDMTRLGELRNHEWFKSAP